MASSAQLAIKLSTEGESQVTRAMQSVATSIGKVGSAATAPLKALGGLGNAIGDVGKMAAGFALGGALTQMPGLLMDMAKGAAADEQATARLSQTIKNLGGDFDEINGQVNDAIKAGQRLAFSDDDVRDSYQFLAAATGDSAEALKRQKAAMDLARGANIPLATATKMLGKLNAENIEVFKKLGITLGDTASEADALAAVQAKFGGQAAAYANSTAGQFEQAQIAMAEIAESIGAALLPALAAVGRVLADNLPAIQEMIGGVASTISATLTPVIEALGPLFQQAFDAIVTAVQPFVAMLPDLATAAGQVFAFMRDGSGDIEVFRGVLNKLLGPSGAQGVIEVFTNLVGFFRSAVVPLWQDVAGAAQKALGGDLQGALEDAAKALGAYAVKLVNSLAEWARRFVEWVAPFIPPMLAELGKALTALGAWLVNVALPAIGAQLLQWGAAFVAWVAPLIPPMLVELGKALVALNVWAYTVALPAIVTELAKWGAAFIGWVAKDVIPNLPGALKAIDTAVTGFLTTAATTFATKAGEVGKALFDAFMLELGKLAPAAWEAIGGDGAGSLKTMLVSAVNGAMTAAINKAAEMIASLIAMFTSAVNRIRSILRNLPGVPGGGGEGGGEGGGGGGATAQRAGAARAMGGIGTQSNVITIDARGQSPERIAAALTTSLATLARTRVASGVL